nr:hypothetical protein [uncultured Allomuricauda sp.]
MKTAIIYSIIGLLAINSLTAQVKIGDNPQNLNPASLLELESTSRALVITRVTDAQMSSISPLRGALVYNTDQNCLHYYDGTAWINICEALDDSFTTSTDDGTIVITQNGDNYDFSIGLIDGSNIRNFTIGALDIQGGAIDSQHYANNSINPEQHFNVLGSNTRQIIMWDGTDWVYTLESDLQISESDGVIGNEVVGPSDTTLKLEGSGDEIDPYTLDVSEGGITDFEIATGAVTTDEILNSTILEEDIANNAVTITKIGTDGATDADKVLTTDAAGDPQWEDKINFASSTLNNGNIFVGDATNTATGVTMGGDANIDNTGQVTIQPDAVTTVEIGTAGVTDADKVLTTNGAGDPIWENKINFASSTLNDGNIFVGDATNTATGVAMGGDATIDNTGQVTIQPDAVTTVEIGTAGVTDADKVLTTNGAGDPIWENRANFASSALNSGNIFVGNATNTATGVTMGGDATIDNTGQLSIADDVIDAETINIDVAGNGLVQDGTTGALDVNVDDSTIEVNTDQLRVKPSATDGDILTTTGGTVSWQPPAVVAMGKVDASLSPVNTKLSGATVTHPSTGNYTVTFDAARPDSNYIIQLTLYGAPAGSTIQVQNQTTAGFDVVIVSTQPFISFSQPSLTTSTTSAGVPSHTHMGTVDPFFTVQDLTFPQQDAIWYFTITDF